MGDLILNVDFDYKNVTVEGLRFGDNYTKVNINQVEDICVAGGNEEMSLNEKYNRLRFLGGYIYLKSGLSLNIENAGIAFLSLRNSYIQCVNLKTRKAIELEFGSADKELTDGIMWVWDYVIVAKVLIYEKFKLHFLIDPTNDRLKEIRFGNIDEKEYNYSFT